MPALASSHADFMVLAHVGVTTTFKIAVACTALNINPIGVLAVRASARSRGCDTLHPIAMDANNETILYSNIRTEPNAGIWCLDVPRNTIGVGED